MARAKNVTATSQLGGVSGKRAIAGTVAVRDLRNNTREVIERVESGETLTLTVSGRPTAVLGPLPGSSRPRTMPAAAFMARLANSQADPGMGDDIADQLGDETIADIKDPMTLLVDTSVFIAKESGRPIGSIPGDDVAISVVTLGELQMGALAAAGDVAKLAARTATLRLAQAIEPVPIDDDVAYAWARLVVELKGEGKPRMGINDSWIAATAIVHGYGVLTQDNGFASVATRLQVVVV